MSHIAKIDDRVVIFYHPDNISRYTNGDPNLEKKASASAILKNRRRKYLFLFLLVTISMGVVVMPLAMRISSAYTITLSWVNVGNQPQGVVYDSGKGEIFVSNVYDGTVSVINETSHAIVATIPVGSSQTLGPMAYDSVKGEIFVAVAPSSIFDPSTYVKVISDSTNTVVATIKLPLLFALPTGMAYDWGKGTIYVATTVWPTTGDPYPTSQNNVTVISDATNTVIKNITDSSFWRPGALTYDPARNAVFVADTAPNKNDHYYKISVLNDALNSVVAAINLGIDTTYAQPGAIGYDPAKSELFVTEPLIGNVTMISDVSYAILASVHLGGQPYGPGDIAYDQSRSLMWVSDNSFVYALDDATNTLAANVTGFGWALGLAYASHTGDVFAADYYQNKVGVVHPTAESTTATKTVTITATSTTTVTSHVTTTITTTSIPPPVTSTVTSTATATVTNTITNTATTTETSVSTSTETSTQTDTVTSTTTSPVTTTETSTSTVTTTTPVTTTVTSIPPPVTTTETTTATHSVTAPSISVSCSPNSFALGKSTKCTATTIVGATPRGTITFLSSGSGTFVNPPSCQMPYPNILSCKVSYTPSSTGVQTITATYSGDSAFQQAGATTQITVTPAKGLSAPAPTSGAAVSPAGALLASASQAIVGGVASQPTIVGLFSAVLIVGISLLGASRRRWPHLRHHD